METAMVLNQNN